MSAKAAYLLVVEGFADWEPANAIAELRRSGGYRVEVAGFDTAPVTSMGGLTVLPSVTVADIDVDDVAIFVIPGGDRWEDPELEPELVALLAALDSRGIPIAAICGATLAVARAGLTTGRRHTSNGLAYLQEQVPGYSDHDLYVDQPAVRDRGLITASGLANVEFAVAIFEELGVFTDDERGEWADMYRSGRLPQAAD